LVSRVYGKPKETVAVEREESPVDRRLREMSTEELEALVQRGRHLRAVYDDADAVYSAIPPHPVSGRGAGRSGAEAAASGVGGRR
jgi:hypothetical protein